jgi:transitional endoplasmic reticulum ATPase
MAILPEPEHITQLREAVRLSPQNAPLRQALADALLAAGLNPEATIEYRAALAMNPRSPQLKLGLARAFHAEGKNNEALVVLEDLVKSAEAPGRAFVLHAKLLAGVGEVQQAVNQYKLGVSKDPNAADPDFAHRRGRGRCC